MAILASKAEGITLLGQLVIHTLFLLLLALSMIFFMDDGFYQNWFGFLAISSIPALVIINAVWQFSYPAMLARITGQPWRGISFTLLAIGLGMIIAFASAHWIGHGITPPTPFLMMFIILSVVAVMWQLMVFEGWPFNGLSNALKGWAMLVTSYVLAYLLYLVFFDFSLLSGIPESWLAIAPQGMFEPWTAIVYSITTLGVIFAFQLAECRPFAALKTRQSLCSKQPFYGLLFGAAVLVISLLVFWLMTGYFELDPVAFMVRAPVSFLFGLFLIMDTTGNQMFLAIRQPWRGLLLIVLSMMLGGLMCSGYEWFMYGVVDQIVSGAPSYSAELWLANAMLSMTFPLILIYCHFFKFWPLSGISRATPVQELDQA